VRAVAVSSETCKLHVNVKSRSSHVAVGFHASGLGAMAGSPPSEPLGPVGVRATSTVCCTGPASVALRAQTLHRNKHKATKASPRITVASAVSSRLIKHSSLETTDMECKPGFALPRISVCQTET